MERLFDEEEIENLVIRSKFLEFDFKNVSNLFEELMEKIKNEWNDVNERISTLFEDFPLMCSGIRLS